MRSEGWRVGDRNHLNALWLWFCKLTLLTRTILCQPINVNIYSLNASYIQRHSSIECAIYTYLWHESNAVKVIRPNNIKLSPSLLFVLETYFSFLFFVYRVRVFRIYKQHSVVNSFNRENSGFWSISNASCFSLYFRTVKHE